MESKMQNSELFDKVDIDAIGQNCFILLDVLGMRVVADLFFHTD